MLSYLRTAAIGGMLLVILAACGGTATPTNEAAPAGGETTAYPAQSEPAAPAGQETGYPATFEAPAPAEPYPATATP